MICEQLYLGCLSHASYLVGDEESGKAAIVDPRRDTDIYLREAEQRGLEIVEVILTHLHADFLAGHIELRQRTGSRINIGARAATDYDARRLSEGDVIKLGEVQLKVLETPGHTPESISLLVHGGDPAKVAPHAVLTGDCLFIGDVGRPDLMASVGISAEELAAQLHDSLHEKLMKLPDETLVYPAHGAGSMCGKNLSTETVSTIGQQRRFNYALQPMSRDEFVSMITANQPAAPGYFSYDAQRNREEHVTLEENLDRVLEPLDLEDALEHMRAGAQSLDVRDPDAFARGHLEGSLNVGLDGRFATWAGTMISSATTILIIADPGQEQEAALRLGRIGFDRLAGYLEGGVESVGQRPELLRTSDRISPTEAFERLAKAPVPAVIDVRPEAAFGSGHIAGCINLPLTELQDRIGEVPRDAPLLVCCKTGYTSSIAVSVLEQHGHGNLADVRGGFEAWQSSGLPVETPAEA